MDPKIIGLSKAPRSENTKSPTTRGPHSTSKVSKSVSGLSSSLVLGKRSISLKCQDTRKKAKMEEESYDEDKEGRVLSGGRQNKQRVLNVRNANNAEETAGEHLSQIVEIGDIGDIGEIKAQVEAIENVQQLLDLKKEIRERDKEIFRLKRKNEATKEKKDVLRAHIRGQLEAEEGNVCEKGNTLLATLARTMGEIRDFALLWKNLVHDGTSLMLGGETRSLHGLEDNLRSAAQDLHFHRRALMGGDLENRLRDHVESLVQRPQN
ncbi:hypothetical protein B0J14DRAFT_561217 [Halenospora varia]|nr:hypothetical protein B0J14DRAFT_561217 [Halenospora varia]